MWKITAALGLFVLLCNGQTKISTETANLPIQRIGRSDLVAISVYDAPEFTRTARVADDGTIRLPMIKRRIRAAGLMPVELETGVGEALVEEGILIDPFVTVTVAEYHSRPISVMGAVRKPTTLQAFGPTRLLDVLASAEGLGAEAGPEILVTLPPASQDESPVLRRISVKALIDAADADVNIVLNGGEEIRVPEAGKIFVVGNVRKPGAFIARNEDDLTVLKALAMAEGLMPYADRQAYIYRREASGAKNEVVIPLRSIIDRKAPDVPLNASDILYIPDAKGRRLGLATLEKVLFIGSGATSALIYAGVR